MVVACGGDSGAVTTSPTIPTHFGEFAVSTIAVSGDNWVVAVADTPELRRKGLMGVTDLGVIDGMLFVFPEPTASGFWMKDTLIPLDIAFFSADGVLVDLLRMEPCAADPCPVYEPRGQYRYAIETALGRWDAIDQPSLVIGDG